jgi:Transposase DDE domain
MPCQASEPGNRKTASAEVNEGDQLLDRLDAITGATIAAVTADAGYAYAKIFAGLERRAISAVIPPKAEPARTSMQLHWYDS